MALNLFSASGCLLRSGGRGCEGARYFSATRRPWHQRSRNSTPRKKSTQSSSIFFLFCSFLVITFELFAGMPSAAMDMKRPKQASGLLSPSPLISFLQKLQAAALSSNSSSSSSSSFDPKTYVDLPLRFPLNFTAAAFEGLPRSSNGSLSPETFQKFIKAYFYEAGSDLLPYTPPDYVLEPSGFLPNVTNKDVRSWALKVHSIWLELARQISPNVSKEPDQHTLLPLPHATVVPGSRFREIYYWDSYWIIRGLLVSKMYDTAKGIVENLLHLVKVYGFVLNGARTYYENRSQPPLLSAMVREVYAATGDADLLEKALPLLIREHKYWTSDPKNIIIVDGKGCKHSLSRYNAAWNEPRPESFTIDIQVAEVVPSSKQPYLYHDIASAAESGWDFSSRWMRDQMNLSTLFTSSIIPADLNAYLFQMETNIVFVAAELGNKTITQKFSEAAQARRAAINTLLWNDDMGQWLDYVLDRQDCDSESNQTIYIWKKVQQNKSLFASNFIPLWAGLLCSADSRFDKAVHALNVSGLLHSAGIATSLKETGQQWDFPNAWPPLQHMIIEGLALSGSKEAAGLAKTIALRWLQTNYAVYQRTEHMLEKYNATICGGTGGGGEYNLQTGFGWSNGVILSLLNDFEWSWDDFHACSLSSLNQMTMPFNCLQNGVDI